MGICEAFDSIVIRQGGDNTMAMPVTSPSEEVLAR